MSIEVTTVADDEVVIFDGATARRYDGLAPGVAHDLDGTTVTTLPRPGGELLCRFATVNDVHFGEEICGLLDAFPDGPVFRAEPGDPPYPEVMNRGAIEEMAAIDPAVVVVKGDLTDRGTEEEYAAFLACYEPAFGDRLVHVRGNHDAYHGGTYAAWPTRQVDLPGVRLAVIDTSIPASESGQVTADQVAWLDEVGATAAADGVPVIVLGHHHPWNPASHRRDEHYFGINPTDSEALVAVVERRPAIVGYLAGHTHRNRVRRFPSTGEVPYVEVACVKDFPGTWAEYRVFEGGILQVHRRISTAAALAWTEKTRAIYGGMYPDYAFGSIADRCFTFPTR